MTEHGVGGIVNKHIPKSYEMEDVIECHNHSTPKVMNHIHRFNNALFINMKIKVGTLLVPKVFKIGGNYPDWLSSYTFISIICWYYIHADPELCH